MSRMRIDTAEQMTALGHRLGAVLRAGDLVLLTGELGAGKTTLTRGIGEALRVRGAVTSPTFVLARTHPREGGGPPLVHVDAYRLGSALELDDLDIDYAASVVVVEWPRDLLDGVANDRLHLTLRRPAGGDPDDDDEPREVTVESTGDRGRELADALGD